MRSGNHSGAAPLDLDQDGNATREASAIRPDHYRGGSIEPWDYAFSQGWGPAFCKANVVKYVTREGRKNGLEDLKKARAYLDKLIVETEAGRA